MNLYLILMIVSYLATWYVRCLHSNGKYTRTSPGPIPLGITPTVPHCPTHVRGVRCNSRAGTLYCVLNVNSKIPKRIKYFVGVS